MSAQLQAHLSLLRYAARTDTLERLHESIEAEIARMVDEIRRAEEIGPEEYAEHVNETSRLLIEELLGVAMTAAQVYLTGIRCRVVGLANAYRREVKTELTLGGIPALDPSEEKGYCLFKYTCEPQCQSGYTPIEAINAIANYWKHHKEWPTTWTFGSEWSSLEWNEEKKGIYKKTIEIVTALGMARSGVWNMQVAVKELGAEGDSYDLGPVRHVLRRWTASLLREIEVQIMAAPKRMSLPSNEFPPMSHRPV